MRNVLKKLRNRKFLLKSIVSMILVTAIPILACFHFYQRYSRNAIVAMLEEKDQQNLSAHINEMDSLLLQLSEICDVIGNDSRFFDEGLDNDAAAQVQIMGVLSRYKTFTSNVSNIFFVSMDSPYLYTNSGTFTLDLYRNSDMTSPAGYAIAPQNLVFSKVAYFTSSRLNSSVLTSSQPTIELIYPVHFGRALVGFQFSVTQFSKMSQARNTGLMIVNPQGEILYSSSEIFTALTHEEVLALLKGPSGTSEVELNGIRYSVVQAYSKRAAFAELYFSSPEMQLRSLESLDRTFIIMLGLMILVCSVFTLLLARWNYRPIKALHHYADSITVQESESRNEVDAITASMRSLFQQYSNLQTLQRQHQQRDLILALTHNPVSEGTLQRCQSSQPPLLASTMQFCILRINTSDQQFKQNKIEKIKKKLSVFASAYDAKDNRSDDVCLLLCGDVLDQEHLTVLLEELCSQNWGVLAIGVGKPVTDPSLLPQSCLEARIALQKCTQNSDSNLGFYPIQEPVPEQTTDLIEEIDALSAAIIAQNADQIRTRCNALLQRIQSQQVLPLRQCYAAINAVLRCAKQNPVLSEAMRASSLYSSGNIVFENTDDFVLFFNGFIQIILDYISEEKDCYGKACVEIQNRLLDPTLCPESVADALRISLSALNRLFHEHSNQSVSAYITYLRREYAKAQLRNTDITISALAEQLGYSQASSFIRNFKREEGMTPGDYRAGIRQAQ